jgi:sulfur-oxidizing protein SoxZ
VAGPLINVPSLVARGTIVEVKTLIAHPMESGFRTGPNGQILPRNIITRFECTFNGTPVFDMALSPAIAANPFISFHLRITEPGTLTLHWRGDLEFDLVESRQIQVSN